MFRANAEARNFRLFGPDETASNRLDDVVDLSRLQDESQHLTDQLVRHVRHITAHGEDLPEIRNWRWPGP